MSEVWQVIVDCVSCRTEGSATELHIPAGLLSSSCQVCGATRESADEPPSGGVNMADPEQALAALNRWAQREGLSLDELVDGVLGSSLDDVLLLYAQREPVPTLLDVLAFLFPGSSAGAVSTKARPAQAPSIDESTPERQPNDPRAPARFLVSVMLADGAIRSSESAFIDRFLRQHGMEPIQPNELRPWRPFELGPIRDRELAEATLKAAVELMHLDGVGDHSERRIVRTFARVQGINELTIDAWDRTFDRHYAPPGRTLWRALSRWVR